MPWVEPWPFTVHVAGFETDCEGLGGDHGVRAWSWGVLVVILEAGVVWEVFALGEDASGIKLLKLNGLGVCYFAIVRAEGLIPLQIGRIGSGKVI
jgi:hypothetical protein